IKTLRQDVDVSGLCTDGRENAYSLRAGAAGLSDCCGRVAEKTNVEPGRFVGRQRRNETCLNRSGTRRLGHDAKCAKSPRARIRDFRIENTMAQRHPAKRSAVSPFGKARTDNARPARFERVSKDIGGRDFRMRAY